VVGGIERCQGSDENLPGRELFQEVVHPLEGTRSLRRHLAQSYVAMEWGICRMSVNDMSVIIGNAPLLDCAARTLAS
jgi:hypothetical protein